MKKIILPVLVLCIVGVFMSCKSLLFWTLMIFFTLRDTLTAEFKLDPASISLSKHIFDDLQLDSLDLVELIAGMKDYTNSEIDTSVYKDARTVQDLVDLLQPFWKDAGLRQSPFFSKEAV